MGCGGVPGLKHVHEHQEGLSVNLVTNFSFSFLTQMAAEEALPKEMLTPSHSFWTDFTWFLLAISDRRG